MATQQAAVALLSQTILSAQLISAQTPTSVVTLPTGCSSLQISFPNIDPTALLGLASTMSATVGISRDGGTTWTWDQLAFTWVGGAAKKTGDDGLPKIGRSLQGVDGLMTKTLVTASAFLTDVKLDIF